VGEHRIEAAGFPVHLPIVAQIPAVILAVVTEEGSSGQEREKLGQARMSTILELASTGHTDKAIAEQLGVSVHTVDYYWRRIRTWLGVSSRAEAVAQWISKGQGDTSETHRVFRKIRSWPGL
jgi:DNA-binding CsgD family transcriptional regulator